MMLKSVDSANRVAIPLGSLHHPVMEAAPLPTGPQGFQFAAHKVLAASAIGPNQLMQYISVEGGGLHRQSERVL